MINVLLESVHIQGHMWGVWQNRCNKLRQKISYITLSRQGLTDKIYNIQPDCELPLVYMPVLFWVTFGIIV